jgi:methyl-accepting chemotaxis protein
MASPSPVTARTSFGVGARIYLAVGLLATLTVGATSLAWWSYGGVGTAVDSLVDEKLPLVAQAHSLSQAATMVVAIAPKLADVPTDAARQDVAQALGEQIGKMRTGVTALAATAPTAAAELEPAIGGLSRQTAELDRIAQARLALDAKTTDAAEALSKRRDAFVQKIAGEADEAQFNVVLGLETAAGAKDGAGLADLAAKDFPLFGSALSLQSEVNQVSALLQEVSQISRRERLGPARERFQASAAKVQKGLAEIGKIAPDPKRAELAKAVLAIGEGPDGLFALRQASFDLDDAMQRQFTVTNDVAAGLRRTIEAHSLKTQDRAVEVAQATRAVIASNRLLLVGLGGLAVLSAVIIAFGFVRPLIVKRLLRLWTDTQAIAGGALDTEVGIKGRDEIAEIAASVLAFRDNARALRIAEAEKLSGEAAEKARRAQMLGALASAFGDVVEAAANGDFGKRVDTRFADPELNQLAGSVNALVEMVQNGLDETCAVLAQLSRGDLSARIEGDYRGAFAELKSGANALGEEFESTLARLADAIAAVRTATAEIVAGVTDLAARTAQESDAVSNATGQIAHFTDTVQGTAGKAKQSVGMATDAERNAQRGDGVVRDTRQAIERIQNSSSRISDIIDLIDEIAFQTNLLALNAAVEAARAGDAGRGFAVVAAEVRSLAQRATGASNDVKRLVQEAQNDVSSGVALVGETAAVFTSIADSVKSVTLLMQSIAETSESQASEVTSIGAEINGIGDMAHQNAALVEETNAAIAVTDEQVRALEEFMSRFRFTRRAQGSMRLVA